MSSLIVAAAQEEIEIKEEMSSFFLAAAYEESRNRGEQEARTLVWLQLPGKSQIYRTALKVLIVGTVDLSSFLHKKLAMGAEF
jgi:hypothetical protein